MLLAAFAGILAPSLAVATKAVPFSAIAVDARTGKIISSIDADGRRHPASLTKMMTLYMTFEALRDRIEDLPDHVVFHGPVIPSSGPTLHCDTNSLTRQPLDPDEV